ncbi:hypothetical protein [Microcoleus sp. AT8-B5]
MIEGKTAEPILKRLKLELLITDTNPIEKVIANVKQAVQKIITI